MLNRHLLDSNIPYLKVSLSGISIGTLAKTKEGAVAFQYESSWLENGFSISPFSLPLESKVFLANIQPFSGLHGIFDDSMPDGWGRLLLDRLLRKARIDPLSIDVLTRLAIVGQSGMGALEYQPSLQLVESAKTVDLDQIAEECAELLRSDDAQSFDELFLLGGSSGGARPKILTKIDNSDWIVKFPSSHDPKDIGAREYDLAKRAQKCGIDMPEVRLMPSKLCEGYFATKRFDREEVNNAKNGISEDGNRAIKKIHMASAGALLETTHRVPNLDYDILLKLTLMLTSSIDEVLKMFRLMTFNVYAGNRDDHAKNFSFLCDDEGNWRLSPGYDLTENAGFNGEHTTTVNGKGKDISAEDIEAVGARAGLRSQDIRETIELVRDVLNK